MSTQAFSSVRIFSWDPQALEQLPEGRGMEGMCELSGSCSSPTLISDASVHKGTQRGLANQLCMKKEKTALQCFPCNSLPPSSGDSLFLQEPLQLRFGE